jgi:hypothetical protein
MVGLCRTLRNSSRLRAFDKYVYSPWRGPAPAAAGFGCRYGHRHRRRDRCLRADDHARRDRWGFGVILVTDALCSSADDTHDAVMNVYMNRFGEQIECVTAETLLYS